MNLFAVQVALNKRLAALLDSESPKVPLIEENVEFPASRLFVRATFATGEPVAAGLGQSAKTRIEGDYVIDVFLRTRTGKGQASQLSDKISNHFARGTVIPAGSVNIRVRSAGPTGGTIDDGLYHLPIHVRWYCYF